MSEDEFFSICAAYIIPLNRWKYRQSGESGLGFSLLVLWELNYQKIVQKC